MEKIYFQKKSSSKLATLIKSFWLIDDHDRLRVQIEKIIPDGYPELIFHSGDLYKINIDGSWRLQNRNLMAGQIKNHFSCSAKFVTSWHSYKDTVFNSYSFAHHFVYCHVENRFFEVANFEERID